MIVLPVLFNLLFVTIFTSCSEHMVVFSDELFALRKQCLANYLAYMWNWILLQPTWDPISLNFAYSLSSGGLNLITHSLGTKPSFPVLIKRAQNQASFLSRTCMKSRVPKLSSCLHVALQSFVAIYLQEIRRAYVYVQLYDTKYTVSKMWPSTSCVSMLQIL